MSVCPYIIFHLCCLWLHIVLTVSKKKIYLFSSTFFIALLDFFVSRTLRSCLRTNTATSTCRTSPTPSTTPWIRTRTRKKNCKCRLCVWRIFYICYFCIARHFYQIWRIFLSAPLFSRLFVHPFIKWLIF